MPLQLFYSDAVMMVQPRVQPCTVSLSSALSPSLVVACEHAHTDLGAEVEKASFDQILGNLDLIQLKANNTNHKS